MATVEGLIGKLASLIEEAGNVARLFAFGVSTQTEGLNHRATAWIASANHVIVLICPDELNAYRKVIDSTIRESHESNGSDVRWYMARIAAVLVQVAKDARAGLLTSLADGIRVEVFDDFLEHAKHYAFGNKKSEAGVIAGVVFEDSLRRLCAKRQIVEKGVNLDALISALMADGTLSATKAKRARAAAHVRTKATHAQWDEFDMRDVESAIDFTEEVLLLLDR